jgi:hypothetical protein
MRELTGQELRDIGLLKHYRIIRRWVCKKTGLNNADLELLIYFDCIGEFRKHDYEEGILTYSWDNRRWNMLLKEGWIVKWRGFDRAADQSHSIYKVSLRCVNIIQQMYRIMLGKEDIPTSMRRNPIMKRKTYTDKVMSAAIKNINKDKTR